MRVLASLGVAWALVVGGCSEEQPAATGASRNIQVPVVAGKAAGLTTGDPGMSAMGRRAAHERRQLLGQKSDDTCENGAEECQGDEGFQDPDGPNGGNQAETSIAIDDTGTHVVIGFNDFRGFNLNPTSVSGFMYSDDGGKTFVDGGQLPSPGNDAIGTTLLPQVFGDPEVKYLGGCNFIYSSIIVTKFGPTVAAQTMGFHRSTDCGHTWEGPFEIPPATNPNGLLTAMGAPRDAADKEFMDVDRASGRVILSWTNFTPVAPGREMSTTFSDNVLGATPTWSARSIVSNRVGDGQASIPRFGPTGTQDVYLAWSRFPVAFHNSIGFARSPDSGQTWGAPIETTAAPFFTADLILGNDRVNNSPSLAVDKSSSRYRGNIYVTYVQNDDLDGGDVVFQRSTDRGQTFSDPVTISSRPGADRSQWFPWVAVDSLSGRVFVFYYDQGIAPSGDLTETTFTFSDDGGVTWAQPRPLTRRPFRGGFGNDTSQPNLGDYNQAVAQNGSLYAVWAGTRPIGFTDGEPQSLSMTVPEVNFRKVSLLEQLPTTSVFLGPIAVSDSGGNGFLDPGETARLTLPLTNYITNPLNARSIRLLLAFVTTSTPGAKVIQPLGLYGTLAPGATATNVVPVAIRLDPTFVPGTSIELSVVAASLNGLPTTLLATLHTGTPVPTTLLAENFDGADPGTLPAGWSSVHAGGANVVPWITSSTFCGTSSNAAFHADAIDGPAGRSAARFERLFSPVVTIPADSEYVTLDFDVCYDTEDQPPFGVFAFDGFFVRITDGTTGHLLRSVLAEAYADEFTTGSFFHYPKHLPRSNDPAYFQDMSAWAGDSQGMQHVHMRLPGMAGTTVQLRIEYTQDAVGTCADVRPGHACGVLLDNVVMNSVISAR